MLHRLWYNTTGVQPPSQVGGSVQVLQRLWYNTAGVPPPSQVGGRVQVLHRLVHNTGGIPYHHTPSCQSGQGRVDGAAAKGRQQQQQKTQPRVK